MNITTFKALSNRNYRLYFSGQSISLIGTWMQRTAVYWLVYTRTHSAFMLGLAVFAAQFPSFILSPLGGVISDRYNRYRVLFFTQIASLVQASLLTILVVFTHYSVAEILGFSVVLGTINAFDVPARQSLVVDLIGKKENLANAIALNSSMVNLARLIGPAISGIVLEKFGAGTCFLINAVSFLSVITSLLFMRLPQYVSKPHTQKVIGEFKEGWRYLAKTPSIGFVILMLACVSFLVLPFSTLLPVYAKVIFKGSASTFGYLNSAIGLGAIAGAFFLASLKPGANLKKIIFINLVIFGAGLILFSHMTNLAIALFFAIIAGFGMMSQTTISNTIIQTSVAPAMRGRVISYFAMAFFGMQPLGGLLIGTLSEYFGAPNTVLAEGIAGLLIAAIFYSFLKRKTLKEEAEIKIIELEDQTINPLVNTK
jgi:MFS family permease